MSTTASLHSDTPSQRPPTPAKDLEYGLPASNPTAAAPSTGPSSRPQSLRQSSNKAPDRQSQNGELAWNPQHPCFPHANPHIPLASPLHATTRIIRIPRDWMVVGDLAPTFSNTYPEILELWVSEADFRTLIKGVNERLVEAFDPLGWRAWMDVILGLATGWLYEDLGFSKVKRGCQDVESFIEKWNGERSRGVEKDEEGELVRAIPLRRTGYLSLDIQIPDPRVGVMWEGEEEEGKGSGVEGGEGRTERETFLDTT